MVTATNAATPLSRPVSGKGAGARTLVIHTATRTAFSLADSLEALKMRLRRVATQVHSVSAATVSSNASVSADYLVVYCPQSHPALPTDLVQTIANANRPVLWVGFGADQLAALPRFREQVEISAFSAGKAATNVNYAGRLWEVAVDPWIPVILQSNSTARVIMSFDEPGQARNVSRPICWKIGHVTFFAADPTFGPLGYLFDDLLLDFFEATEVQAPRMFLRIEDYHCRRNHPEFKRMVDFLYARDHPFMVAVVPAFRDPQTGRIEDLDSQPEFVAALRYAQQRGGRLILHGYTHDSREASRAGREFWDAESDRPFADDDAEHARERLHNGVRQMLKHGLSPLAWETPHYAASAEAYSEIAKVFSTSVERVQLSDATAQVTFDSAALTQDRFGRLIVPENLGYVLDAPTNFLAGIKMRGDVLTKLRGTVAGCYIHPYQPLEKLAALVETLEGFNVAFLDLAELDHRVALPDALLLTGKASTTVNLRNVTVRRRAFDRTGNLLEEKMERTVSSGRRTFRRTGVGDYELFEFLETTP